MTTKTIVAYTLKGEDHTAELVAKQGLFWLVTNDEKGEHKIPAKAVDETWEEADEESLAQEPVELEQPVETEPREVDIPSLVAPTPSLATQALEGPVIADPGSHITLAELCDTYGVVPRIARRQLRAAAAEGQLAHDPRTGWVFSRDQAAIDQVMKIITTRKRG